MDPLLKAMLVVKHMGPGNHPNGTPQIIHGVGRRLFDMMDQRVHTATGDFDPEGGFSLSRVTGTEPEHGAMCSILKSAELKMTYDEWGTNGKDRVRRWMERPDVAEAVRSPGVYIGGWVYEGSIYLDVSRDFPTLDLAMKQAKSLGELAVFNLDDPKAEPFTSVMVKAAEPATLVLFNPRAGHLDQFVASISREMLRHMKPDVVA